MDKKTQLRYLISIICIVSILLILAIYYGFYSDTLVDGTRALLRDMIPNVIIALIAIPTVYVLFERKGIFLSGEISSDNSQDVNNIADEISRRVEESLRNIQTTDRQQIISFYPNWRDFQWTEQLDGIKELEIVVSYWSGWIAAHMDYIVQIFDRNGRVSLILPSPFENAAVLGTRELFPEHSADSVKREIELTVATLLVAYERSSSNNKQLDIRYYPSRLNYAAARFDKKRLYYGFYEHFREFRISSSACLLDLESSQTLSEFWQKEFNGFNEVSKSVSISEATALKKKLMSRSALFSD